MKVVFDTSALVRLAAGRSGLIGLKTAAGNGLAIITSAYLLDELERTLRERMGSTRQRAHSTTRAFAKLAQVIPVAPADIKKRSRDPTDDPVIAAAVRSKADVLVSSDFDLLDLKTVGKVKIITYSEFLKQLSGWVSGR